jgi:hypothetical protein
LVAVTANLVGATMLFEHARRSCIESVLNVTRPIAPTPRASSSPSR